MRGTGIIVGVLGAMTLSGCTTGGKRAEWVVSGYSGKAWNASADLHLDQPGHDTHATAHDVPLDDRSFTWSPPPNYGVRLWRWNHWNSQWGFMFDYQHPKAIADPNGIRTFSGMKDGVPVSGDLPLSTVFERWRLSFGHNMATLNVCHRWFPKGCRDRSLLGRIQPYVGFGAGAAIPSPLIQVDGVRTVGYRVAGPALQAFAGANVDLWGPFSFFAETKLSYADVTVSLEGGGTSSAEVWTYNLLFGASVHF
jgi:lipid A oxidase